MIHCWFCAFHRGVAAARTFLFSRRSALATRHAGDFFAEAWWGGGRRGVCGCGVRRRVKVKVERIVEADKIRQISER